MSKFWHVKIQIHSYSGRNLRIKQRHRPTYLSPIIFNLIFNTSFIQMNQKLLLGLFLNIAFKDMHFCPELLLCINLFSNKRSNQPHMSLPKEKIGLRYPLPRPVLLMKNEWLNPRVLDNCWYAIQFQFQSADKFKAYANLFLIYFS